MNWICTQRSHCNKYTHSFHRYVIFSYHFDRANIKPIYYSVIKSIRNRCFHELNKTGHANRWLLALVVFSAAIAIVWTQFIIVRIFLLDELIIKLVWCYNQNRPYCKSEPLLMLRLRVHHQLSAPSKRFTLLSNYRSGCCLEVSVAMKEKKSKTKTVKKERCSVNAFMWHFSRCIKGQVRVVWYI